MTQSDWKDDIYTKLISIFEKDVEALTRIIFYLDEEDKQYKDYASIVPPAWRSLKLTLNSNAAFKRYAERLADDTKRAETDVEFRKTMGKVYAQMMDPSEDTAPEDLGQDWDIARLADTNLSTISAFMGLSRAWGIIPVSAQTQILEMIPRVVANRQMIASIDEVVSLVNKTGGTVVMVGLAALTLGYDVIKNLMRWWSGEITGKRCAKNIVDSFFTIGAGVAGGVGGAAIGSFAGPIGTVIGGIAGGIVSSHVMNIVMDRLTQSIFGIPKDEALENAYNFIGVKMNASNNEINSNFRKLCLKHHPDKGGNKEEFLLVQINMSVIKLSRGEM